MEIHFLRGFCVLMLVTGCMTEGDNPPPETAPAPAPAPAPKPAPQQSQPASASYNYQLTTMKGGLDDILLSWERLYLSFECGLMSYFSYLDDIREYFVDYSVANYRYYEYGPELCRNLLIAGFYAFPVDPDFQKTLYEKKIPVIWVIGAPNTGKTTLSKALATKMGYVSITYKELLRAEIEKHPDLIYSKILKERVQNSVHIPNSVLLSFIAKEMELHLKTAKGFIIDGFPKGLGQAKMFQLNIVTPNAIISLQAKDDVLKKRFEERKKAAKKEDVPLDVNVDMLPRRIALSHEREKLIKHEFRHYKEINAEGETDATVKLAEEAIKEALKDMGQQTGAA